MSASLLDEADARDEIVGEIVVVPFINPVGAAMCINGVLVGRNDLGGEGNFNRHWPSVRKSVAAEARLELGADETDDLRLLRRIPGRHAEELPEQSKVQKIKETAFQLAFDADVATDVHCDREAIDVRLRRNANDSEVAICSRTEDERRAAAMAEARAFAVTQGPATKLRVKGPHGTVKISVAKAASDRLRTCIPLTRT